MESDFARASRQVPQIIPWLGLVLTEPLSPCSHLQLRFRGGVRGRAARWRELWGQQLRGVSAVRATSVVVL